MRADVECIFLPADRRDFKLSSFLWCIRSFSSSFRASEAVVITHEGRSLLCNAPTFVGHDEISFLMRYQEEAILVPAMDIRSHLRSIQESVGRRHYLSMLLDSYPRSR